MEASDIAVLAVDFVVGRGRKQSLDLFLLGQYSCRGGDLQVTVVGLCLSPPEGGEILALCCFPTLASQVSLHFPSCFISCGLPSFGADGMIIIRG